LEHPIDHVIPVVGGLFCLDIGWVVFCMTGALDLYVKQALIIMLCVLLVVGNLCLFLYLIYHWWQQHAVVKDYNKMKAMAGSLGKGAVSVIAKVDGMYDKIVPNGDAVKKFFQNAGEWDSEDEDDEKADCWQDAQPPDDNAKQLGPIKITIVRAEGLMAADNKIPKEGRKVLSKLGVMSDGAAQGFSDPYVSVVTRGRKKACWHKTGYLKNTVTPVWKKDNGIKIQDFREGDVIKFKMWDDDSHENHLGIAHDDLLGKAQMNSSQIIENIGQEECELKLLLGKEDKEYHKVKLTTPREGYGRMFVRVERKGGSRASIAEAEAAVLEGEEDIVKKLKMKGGCC